MTLMQVVGVNNLLVSSVYDNFNEVCVLQQVLPTNFDNTKVIERNYNWVQPGFLESLHTKRYNPMLNMGIKTGK